MNETSKIVVSDGYQNLVAGLGTERDKAAHGSYAEAAYSPAELLTIYRSAWLPRKIIDIVAHDATRLWRLWNADKNEISKLEAEEKRLGVQQKVREAKILARLYGGAAIFISTHEQDVEKPLDPEAEAKKGIRHLTVIPKQMLASTEQTLLDLNSTRFGKPEFYSIAGQHGMTKIHHSRFIKQCGAPIPWGDATFHDDWGDSILVALMDAIRQADGTAANVASLVFEAKVDVIHVPRLMELISTPEGERMVKEYIRVAMTAKSTNGALVLDGGDTSKPDEQSGGTRYETKSQSFGGLDALFDRFLQAASGAADIPATRLLSQSPAGMNSTGESDIRNYYDHIQSIQNLEIGPEMALFDELLVRSVLGKHDDSVFYEWRPLWQVTSKEKVDIGKTTAGIIGDMQKMKLWPDEVLSEAGANALIETGAIPGLEAAIDDWEENGGELYEEPDLGQTDLDRVPPAGTKVGDAQRLPYIPESWTIGDVAAWMSQPRHPAGSPEGGRWSGGPSASLYGPSAPGTKNGSGHLSMDQKARTELIDAREAAKNYVLSEKYFAEGINQEEAYYGVQGKLVERLSESPEFPLTKNADSVIRPKTEITPEVRSELRGKSNFGFDYRESKTADFSLTKKPGLVDRAAHAFEAKKPFTTYRGVKGSFASKILGMGPGDEYQESESASTSYSASIASNYAGIGGEPGVVVAIRVRKGDAVAPTVKYSEFKMEKELTLPAGTKYRVVGVDKDARTAVVEIVNQPKIENGQFIKDEAYDGATVVIDMAPKTLYARRDVKNTADIVRWAKAQGIVDLVDPSSMHVTLIYSKTPLDWMQVGEAWDDEVKIHSGGPRSVERFGEATVLEFASGQLKWRHDDALRAGATTDFDPYRPHITLSYTPQDLSKIEPYTGRIELGHEIFEEIDLEWKEKLLAKPSVVTHDFDPNQPRDKNGQWTDTGGGGQFAPKSGGGRGPSGINFDAAGLSDDWGKHKPNDTTKKFQEAGVSPRQLVESLLPEGSFQDSDTVEVTIATSKGGFQAVNVRVGVMGDPVEVHRMFYIDSSGKLVASHERIVLSEKTQGKGLARSALSKSMDLYEKAGVDRIETVASLSAGGYVWAKFGFTPANDTSWAHVKVGVRDNLLMRNGRDLKKEWEKDGGPLDLYNDNPKEIWKIADHPRGKEALVGTSWIAELKLGDSEAMARFNKYTGRS